MAKKPPKEDKEEQEKEYLAILAIFKRLLDAVSEDMEQWEILEELMALRAEFAIQHAIKGFDMDYDKALELVRNYDGELSALDDEKRKILVAAIDNLVDFAVGEEYQMSVELPDIDDLEEEYLEEEYLELLESICHKYNFRYANVENLDIEYAMAVAAGLVGVPQTTVLTYMTQGDERVRPWHLQYEGYSAPKAHFPAWLIPPIEHMCRCFLVEESAFAGLSGVAASSGRKLEKPEWFNPVFKESVALGGRIFSEEHRYFSCEEQHKDRLIEIASRIKNKYLTNG
ncbi:MAG: hypothetical protein LBL79_07755 [Prevotella sp.]|jgi:hypothetical protein|nr:hypothetical protein [Prevotella sp.]